MNLSPPALPCCDELFLRLLHMKPVLLDAGIHREWQHLYSILNPREECGSALPQLGCARMAMPAPSCTQRMSVLTPPGHCSTRDAAEQLMVWIVTRAGRIAACIPHQQL